MLERADLTRYRKDCNFVACWRPYYSDSCCYELTLYPTINEYEPTNEDWSQFAANEIESVERKRAVLLTLVMRAATIYSCAVLWLQRNPARRVTTSECHHCLNISTFRRRLSFVHSSSIRDVGSLVSLLPCLLLNSVPCQRTVSLEASWKTC